MCEELVNKVCSTCHVEKSTEYFYKDENSKDGFQYYCKECAGISQRARQKNNKAREIITIPEFKTCPNCCLEKPGSDFRKYNGNKDGLQGHCKECNTKANKSLHEKNKARENIVIPEFKTCPECGISKPSSFFIKSARSKDGLNCCCKQCAAIRGRKYLYGVTEEWVVATLEAQGGACAICKFIPGPEDMGLDLDHEHGGAARGFLHRGCNLGLGFFKDDVRRIKTAIQYLSEPTLGIRYKRTLSKDVREAILASQSYQCKICSVDLHNKKACLDHDHITHMIRGYLCNNCNCGLGKFKDSIPLLQSAINYLTKYSSLYPPRTNLNLTLADT
jgi:hypothetical protein